MQEAAHICSRNFIDHARGYSRNNWKGVEGPESYFRNTQIPYHYYHLLSFIFIIIIIIIVIIIIIICSRQLEGVSIVLPQKPITYFHL